MKALKVSAKWPHEDVKRIYHALLDWHPFQLERNTEIVYTQLKILLFLQNYYNCFKGSNTSTYFELNSPNIDKYTFSI